MNNGIDLDAIPGQKAARNREVVRNPPKKNRNVLNRNRNQRRANNAFVQIPPRRNLPRQGNPYYNQRVEEQAARKNPVLSQRIDHFQQLSWQDHVGSLLAMVLGLCIVVCCFILFWLVFMEVTVFVAEQVIEPFFSFVSDNENLIFHLGTLLWWAHLIILVYLLTQLLATMFGGF